MKSFEDQAKGIAKDMTDSHFIQTRSFTTCIRYTSIEKLFLTNYDFHNFAKLQIKRESGGHELDVTLLDDSTLFVSNFENVEILVIATDSRLKNLSFFPSFPSNHFII